MSGISGTDVAERRVDCLVGSGGERLSVLRGVIFVK